MSARLGFEALLLADEFADWRTIVHSSEVPTTILTSPKA